MTVMAPIDEDELVSMLDFALNIEGPCAFRYPRSSAMDKRRKRACSPIEYGRGVLLEDGKDLAIIALGSMLYPSLDALAILRREGVSAAVLNARFAKPVDESLILEISRKCKRALVVEEASVIGGLGSEVADILSKKAQGKVAFAHLGIPDDFVTHGPREILLAECGLSAMGIAEAALRLCKPRGTVSMAHEVAQSVSSSIEGVT
jgi:1-deoxy-D-xylulose-5-phosphate synthase